MTCSMYPESERADVVGRAVLRRSSSLTGCCKDYVHAAGALLTTCLGCATMPVGASRCMGGGPVEGKLALGMRSSQVG